jgi:N-acetyl-gamma-glutamylphosphate reductase
MPRLKDVAGSNHARARGPSLHADSVVMLHVIDNLLKGAAGGSVQWMNRLLGLPETAGLNAPAPRLDLNRNGKADARRPTTPDGARRR